MTNVFLEQTRHTSDENIITELSDEEVFDFLSSVKLGRLVVRSGEDIDIYPVNYVVDPVPHVRGVKAGLADRQR